MSEAESLKDVEFMTSMLLSVLGNYAQTGHHGGPLAYAPSCVALHLGRASNGALSYDIRNPKQPLSDKFMLCGGHCIPVCYALWIILYEAMRKEEAKTGDKRYHCDEKTALLGIDALGFRRSPGALETLLQDAGVADEELFAQAKIRGIRALMGHSETTDATNDCNGGPSGVAVTTVTGKAVFWDRLKAPSSLKCWALEGEFAFTEGHAQELKTTALAQQTGKRVRLFFSWNNAGIDAALVGPNSVIRETYADAFDLKQQFSSYGWNVFEVEEGCDQQALLKTMKEMEEWSDDDKRPMILFAHTVKGYWPVKIDDQIVGYQSHPYGHKMNSPYFVKLASSFEEKYGVKFTGLDSLPGSEAERLRHFVTNVNVILSVLDQNDGKLNKFVASRLLEIAEEHNGKTEAFVAALEGIPDKKKNPFADPRMDVANLPRTAVSVTDSNGKERKISLFLSAGTKLGARRAISEICAWMNHCTGNNLVTVAADLSNSINLENGHLSGHYDSLTNPRGTRLQGAIQEAANTCTISGICSQSISFDPEVHVGMHAISGTYGAFTPLMYVPMRSFSQQNQDSPFALGVATVIAGHSGPETAADGKSHFGIFSPQIWKMFPKGQVCNLHLWDYNDVAAGYFSALNLAVKKKELGVIVIHVARPDLPVADRSRFHDKDEAAAARGAYIIRERNPEGPKHGTVLLQGASATFNAVSLLDKLEEEKLNVRLVAVISEDLLDYQDKEFQERILPQCERYDCMYVTTGTKREPPLSNLGPQTEAYSLSSDWDDKWRTGGLEPDIIAEAHLDSPSILSAIRRFVNERPARLSSLKAAFSALE